MAFDYAKTAALATRLITRFGRTGTLRSVTIADRWNPSPANSDSTVTFVDLEIVQGNAMGHMPGNLSASSMGGETRRTLYVETSGGTAPAKGDKIQIGSDWHEIEDVKPLQPGGTAVLWTVTLAR